MSETTALMTAFAGRRLAQEGKRRFGGWFGGLFNNRHGRMMSRARQRGAEMVPAESKGAFSVEEAERIGKNVSDDQIYAALRTQAVMTGGLSDDADEETWWEYFRSTILPKMWEWAKIIAPIVAQLLIAILISGT